MREYKGTGGRVGRRVAFLLLGKVGLCLSNSGPRSSWIANALVVVMNASEARAKATALRDYLDPVSRFLHPAVPRRKHSHHSLGRTAHLHLANPRDLRVRTARSAPQAKASELRGLSQIMLSRMQQPSEASVIVTMRATARL